MSNGGDFENFHLYMFLASGGEVEYLPVFYAVNDVFMEIFCLCIQLVNKTWREMHATSTDIDRVRKNKGRVKCSSFFHNDRS